MEYAVREGDTALAERLLKAGVDPDAVISLDDTALGIAAQNGHLGVARALIAAGADVNRRSGINTPLKYAAKFHQPEMVKLLLEAGAVSSGAAAAAAAAARAAAAGAAAALSLEPGADFGQAVAALERALGAPRTAVAGSDRAVGLLVSEFHAHQVVTAQQDALLRAGCFAFYYADSIGGCLALMPATGPLDAVRELGTAGTNWRVTNDAVVAWLEATMKRYPMRVLTIGQDRLEARLLRPVDDPTRLAKSIIEICPTWQDDGVGRVVEMIEREQRVSLWWD
ncbi:MAG TPA: ankyrin repeat domain-containing protein [Tepidisphaeraceae bacterium]|nr:ankyrin repeat domain-containing protein [Tepidisphaeraceae bacterium]